MFIHESQASCAVYTVYDKFCLILKRTPICPPGICSTYSMQTQCLGLLKMLALKQESPNSTCLCVFEVIAQGAEFVGHRGLYYICNKAIYFKCHF